VFLEDGDERLADDLALPLRLDHSPEPIEEPLRLVGVVHLEIVALPEIADDLLGLALSQHAVVHEDADQPRPQGPLQQERHDRGIDAARQGRRRRVRPRPYAARRRRPLRRTTAIVQSPRHPQTPKRKFFRTSRPCFV
jgi:hypothetical protein